jgi:chromosome segregation ATPase
MHKLTALFTRKTDDVRAELTALDEATAAHRARQEAIIEALADSPDNADELELEYARLTARLSAAQVKRHRLDERLTAARIEDRAAEYAALCERAAAARRDESEARAAAEMIAAEFNAAQEAYKAASLTARQLMSAVVMDFRLDTAPELRAALTRPMLDTQRRAGLMTPADYAGALEAVERGERAATGQQREELAHAAL